MLLKNTASINRDQLFYQLAVLGDGFLFNNPSVSKASSIWEDENGKGMVGYVLGGKAGGAV